MTGRPPGGIVGGMTTPASDSSADLATVLEQDGVTEEGKQRARAKRLAAEARWTPEQWAHLRAELGLPPRAA